jgi:hypothetical protein
VAQLILQPGETVVTEVRPSPLVTMYAYPFTLGLWEIWRRRKRYLLTNMRVIVTKGLVTRSVQFLPLDRIQDATLSNQLWAAVIGLSSAGGAAGIERLGSLRTRDARAFMHELTARISSGHQGLGGRSGASVADELYKLADLRSKGVLNDTEFEEQKAKLLRS